MSSISEAQRRALIRFYQREILRRAGARARFDTDSSDGATSYYTKREWRPLTRRDFEISLSDRQQIAATLDAYWANGPLSGLGRRIAALSRRFPNVREKSDVSSFIYEMF